MIEQRRLTEDEIEWLIADAPDSETRNLVKFLRENKLSAYEFFDKYALAHFGLLHRKVPFYIAVLIENDDKELEVWTVINKQCNPMVSLCKYAKRELARWVKKYGRTIYATMEASNNPESIKWTKWLGFEAVDNKDGLITLKISSGSGDVLHGQSRFQKA